MARPWSRKRREGVGDDEPTTAREPTDSERLDDESHAWWAKTEVEEVWKPRARRTAQDEEKRDILAEHFGDDWRTSILATPPTEEELEEQRRREQQVVDDQDPYKVLQIEPTASWDEIVVAHRHMARMHHPDRLADASADERAASEDRIRVINQAYQELRVRRGV
jgi:hypothetical protein